MNKVHEAIKDYYSEKIITFGATPKGVDWNGVDGQLLRFSKLIEVVEADNFSISDIGCGYGKLFDYLNSKYNKFSYSGYDLAPEMTKQAQILYNQNDNAEFKTIKSLKEITKADYTTASGIFNVKMELQNKDWLDYILTTLDLMHEKSERGFSFNLLTSFSDKDFMKEKLYYADPMYFFEYCKKNFSKNIALLHDYNLYEFTILVRK